MLINPLWGVALAVAGWSVLRRLKSGRPAGYLFYLLYRSGLARYLPPLLRSRGLVMLPAPFAKNRCLRLSGFSNERDHERTEIRYYLED